MKLIEKVHERLENNCLKSYFKIFGKTIWSETLDCNICYFRFCKGLFSKTTDMNTRIVAYRLFGRRFLKGTFFCCTETYHTRIVHLMFTIKHPEKKILRLLRKYILLMTGKKECTTIGLNFRTGETFLYLHHMHKIIKNMEFQNPIFISPFPYLKPIVKMFYPQEIFLAVPSLFFELHFCKKLTISLKREKFSYFDVLEHEHFVKLEKSLRDGEKKHFYSAIKEKLNLKDNNLKSYKIDGKTIYYANEKLKFLEVKRPFVFISTEAQSNSSCSVFFWNNMSKELKKLGYDVVFNVMKNTTDTQFGKTCFFTFTEAMYVSGLAEAVIGVRSGFMDLVAARSKKMFCFYMPFSHRSSELPYLSASLVKDAFSLKKLPYVKAKYIFEYDMEHENENKALEDVLKKITK